MIPATGLSRRAWLHRLCEPTDAASLAFFRIVFGCMMLYSQLRFVCKGWVKLLYIQPSFYFKYYGFSWVHPLPGNWMYLPWIGMIVCLVLVILGKYYRAAITGFFLLFSYTELLDLTNYLNHYYLITLLAGMMIFLPMQAAFSLDARKQAYMPVVPRWALIALRLQVGLVYFFAGLAKIKYDWLIQAEPLKIWLAACWNLPVIGRVLSMHITAYIFSWTGMLFDLTAPFLLLNKKTRPWEYIVVVFFHLMTLWLFYIGIFPLIMMALALVFFSPAWHRRILEKGIPFLKQENRKAGHPIVLSGNHRWRAICWTLFFIWQLLMPLRYLLYKGNVLWTEQGFRYAWNVMLIEKDGYTEFTVKDLTTGNTYMEFPHKYLTPLQERMMSTQPDMMLQYAHFLANKYRQQLHHAVGVYVYAYVSLNQRPGQLLIDPVADLSREKDNLLPKKWILPLKDF